MVKNYMHENLKQTVIKHLAKKIKMYSHFQKIGIIANMFQISYQTILILSWSYSQTILHTFPDNTDIFRELLVNNTTRFSRVYIKQY